MNKCGVLSVTMVGTLFLATLVYFPVFAENPVDINIVEKVDDESGGLKPWEDITSAMPGMVYSAIPRVKNSGSVPASVKMCLNESGIDSAGNVIELDSGTFTIDINDGYWIKESGEDDGGVVHSPIAVCYKYNSELVANAITEPLFYEVSLSEELGNEHKNATFNLHLYAEATGDLPDEPDTGFNTVSYFDIVKPVFFAAGGIAIFATLAYILRIIYKKRD